MRKICISLIISALTLPAYAIEVQEDLRAAVEQQRQSAQLEQSLGLWGFGLSVGGGLIASIGVATAPPPSQWGYAFQYGGYRSESIYAAVIGGAILLGGAITGLIGWLYALDADTQQSKINSELLSTK